MVAASVTKTGAVTFCDSKAASSNSPPLFQDANLSCQPVDPANHAFFTRGLSLSGNGASVQCYSISSQTAAPVVDRAFVLRSNSVAYVEASRPVTSVNKVTLASVLEFADEVGCSCIYACIKKDNILFTEILRSYNEAGFSSVTPFHHDMVKLQFVI